MYGRERVHGERVKHERVGHHDATFEGNKFLRESGRCLVVRVKASLIDFLRSLKILRQFFCLFIHVCACGLHLGTRLCLLWYGRMCVCSCTAVLEHANLWDERICMDGFVCTFCCSFVFFLTRVPLCTLVLIRCRVGYCLHAKDHGRPTPLVFGCYEKVVCSSLFCFSVCQLGWWSTTTANVAWVIYLN